MPGPFVPLIIGAQVFLAAANGPPTVNIEATCQRAENELTKLFGDRTMATLDACIKQQNEALEAMRRDWATYSAASKARCVQQKGYMPSYAEWLTCFEIEQQVEQLRRRETETIPTQRTR